MISSRGFAGTFEEQINQSTLTELLFVGIFRFGNAVSKRGQQVPRLQVYIDLVSIASCAAAKPARWPSAKPSYLHLPAVLIVAPSSNHYFSLR